jgi:hypothetical protein
MLSIQVRETTEAQNMTIYTDIGKTPLPEGWPLEQVLEVLREVGHTVLRIEAKDGSEIQLPEQAA